MKKYLLLSLSLMTVTASFASVNSTFDCQNKKDSNDTVSLTIKQNGKWHLNDVNGGYSAEMKSGKIRGRFLLFQEPESTSRRGNFSDDVKIESSLFAKNTKSGTVLIIWADEDDQYHTDKFSCEKN